MTKVELLQFMKPPNVEGLLVDAEEAKLAATGLSRSLHGLLLTHVNYALPPEPGDPERQHNLLLSFFGTATAQIWRSNIPGEADFQVQIVRPRAVHLYNGLVTNPQPSVMRLDFTPEEARRHATGEAGSEQDQLVEGLTDFLSGHSGVAVERSEANGLMNFLRRGFPIGQQLPGQTN